MKRKIGVVYNDFSIENSSDDESDNDYIQDSMTFEVLNITRILGRKSPISEQTNIELITKLAIQCKSFNFTTKAIGIFLENHYSPSDIKGQGTLALKGIDGERFKMLKYANELLTSDEQLKFILVNACLDFSDGNRSYNASFFASSKWGKHRNHSIRDCFDSVGKPIFDLSPMRVNRSSFQCIVEIDRQAAVSNYDLCDKALYLRKIQASDHKQTIIANSYSSYSRYMLVFYQKSAELYVFFKLDPNYAIKCLFERHLTMSLEDLGRFAWYVVEEIGEYQGNSNLITHESAEYMLKIFKRMRSFLLTRKFFENYGVSNKLVKPLAQLISHFGWEKLAFSLKWYINPYYNDTLIRTCKLTKELIKLNEDKEANNCFQMVVNYILKNEQDFLRNKPKSIDCNYIKGLCEVAHVLVMLKSEASKQLLDVLVNFVIKNFEPDEIKMFIDEIKINYKVFNGFMSMNMLFEHRCNWLKEKIKSNRVSDWIMKGFTEFFDFNEFLNSDEFSIIYKNFSNIEHAQNFLKICDGVHDIPNYYSVKMELIQCEDGIDVLVTKTNEIYKITKFEQNRSLRRELEQLHRFMNA